MIQLIEMIAVMTSGLYGILQARTARMDVLGVFSVSFATALGGGTLRDVLLDRHPLFWIEHAHYPVIIFAMAIASFMLPRLVDVIRPYLSIPDAIGLGLFSIVGVQYAQQTQSNWFISVMFGVITGTFGGVVSDVLCNRVPVIFRSAPLYATCAFAGGWLYLLLLGLGLVDWIASLLGATGIVLLRFVAIARDIRLPELKDHEV